MIDHRPGNSANRAKSPAFLSFTPFPLSPLLSFLLSALSLPSSSSAGNSRGIDVLSSPTRAVRLDQMRTVSRSVLLASPFRSCMIRNLTGYRQARRFRA